MIEEYVVGPTVNADGVTCNARGGRQGDAIVSELHGRYYEQALRGNLFTGANTAVQALSVGSATATGLILTNPAGSGKNLVLLDASVWIAAAVTAVANIALFANINPVAAAVVHTTPITPRSTLLGIQSGAGLLDSAATLPAAPTLIRSLLGWHWVAAGTATAPIGVKDEIAGAIIVTPGCCVSIQSVTAAHTVIASITWEEVPV